MAKVTLNGNEYDFDAVVNMMNDELREQLHAEGIEDPQEFTDRYAEAHADKFGETFDIC